MIARYPNGKDVYFKVVHPFNPMNQNEYALIERKLAWGEDRVFFIDEHGQYRSIPASWTNFYEEDPFVKLAGGKAFFRYQDLLLLGKLMDKIKQMSK